LRGTGRNDDCARGNLECPTKQGQRSIPGVLASPVLIRQHDHCRTGLGGLRCPRGARVKSIDGACLEDVERFPRGDRSGRVDEDDMPHDVGRGKRASDGAAQFARTENGDGLHRYGIVYVGFCTRLMTLLHGKVAIVTGGSRGIGRAVAAALLGDGASVVITGTDEARLGEARDALSVSDPGIADRLMTARADVRRDADANALMTAAGRRFGGIDILINNAGVGGFAEVAAMTPDEWHRVIDTNLTGVFHCCRAAIPHIKSRGGGWIINVSSLAGKNPFVGGAAYCASKAGLNAFGEALMQEVRHDGIRVSTVMPGSVRTAFSGGGDGPGMEWKLAPDDVAQVIVDLLHHPARSLPSRVELRPARPPRK
jgi:3-oxoacyl-[acyl-carrier protein] reductase